jgi:hypothetical protein
MSRFVSLLAASLLSFGGAEITSACRNKLVDQYRNDGSKMLITATELLQGLSYYPKIEGKTSEHTDPTTGGVQDFPRWLPSCTDTYPFNGGDTQMSKDPSTNLQMCLKSPPPTDTSSLYTEPIQKVGNVLRGSDSEEFGCCDQGSQTTGVLRQLSLSPTARHQRRWEYYSLKNLKSACEENDAETDEAYGTLYFMSALAVKKSASIKYEQIFDDVNVICIPKECHTPKEQVIELMEERARECADNFMDECYYGLSPVTMKNSFLEFKGRTPKDNWLFKVYTEDFGYEVFSSGFEPDSDSRYGGESAAHAKFFTVIGSAKGTWDGAPTE